MSTSQAFKGHITSFCIHEVAVDDMHLRTVVIRVSSGTKTTRLVFEGVYSLKDVCFNVFGSSIVTVEDLSDRGWEGQSYRVNELIGDRFSFYSNSFRRG